MEQKIQLSKQSQLLWPCYVLCIYSCSMMEVVGCLTDIVSHVTG